MKGASSFQLREPGLDQGHDLLQFLPVLVELPNIEDPFFVGALAVGEMPLA